MNDLVGLRYGWGCRPGDGSGMTDCFQLVCEIRRRLGMTDYADRFAWVYDSYTEQAFPRGLITRWVLKNGQRISEPRSGAVALLPTKAGSALGTWLNGIVIFIGPGQNVIQVPLPEGVARYFWMKP